MAKQRALLPMLVYYIQAIHICLYIYLKKGIEGFCFCSKTSPMKGYEGTEAIIETELKRLPWGSLA